MSDKIYADCGNFLGKKNDISCWAPLEADARKIYIQIVEKDVYLGISAYAAVMIVIAGILLVFVNFLTIIKCINAVLKLLLFYCA